jgi:hypothetical protein
MIGNADLQCGTIGIEAPGTEEKIPNDCSVAKITGGDFGITRVMAAMRFRAADDVIQPPIPQSHIAVLKEPVDRIHQEVTRNHLGAHAKQEKRHRIQSEMQCLLERVKTADVQHIQNVR